MHGFCCSGIRGSGKISLWYAMRVNRDKEKLLVTCVCSNIEREAAVRTETIGWIIGILIAAALVWWIYRKIKRKMRQLASTPEVQVLRYVAKHLSEGDLTQPDAPNRVRWREWTGCACRRLQKISRSLTGASGRLRSRQN